MPAGRKPHRATPKRKQMVVQMVAMGTPQRDVAHVLDISLTTLKKHYEHELRTGKIDANYQMAQNLYAKAMGEGPGAVAATIFWLKTQAGWREDETHSEDNAGAGIIVVPMLAESDEWAKRAAAYRDKLSEKGVIDLVDYREVKGQPAAIKR